MTHHVGYSSFTYTRLSSVPCRYFSLNTNTRANTSGSSFDVGFLFYRIIVGYFEVKVLSPYSLRLGD